MFPSISLARDKHNFCGVDFSEAGTCIWHHLSLYASCWTPWHRKEWKKSRECWSELRILRCFLVFSFDIQPIFFPECSLFSLHFEDVNVLYQYCLVITFRNVHGVLIISCPSFPCLFSIPPMSFSHGSSVSIFVEKSVLVSFPGQTTTEKSQKPPKANRSEETAGSHGISKKAWTTKGPPNKEFRRVVKSSESKQSHLNLKISQHSTHQHDLKSSSCYLSVVLRVGHQRLDHLPLHLWHHVMHSAGSFLTQVIRFFGSSPFQPRKSIPLVVVWAFPFEAFQEVVTNSSCTTRQGNTYSTFVRWKKKPFSSWCF